MDLADSPYLVVESTISCPMSVPSNQLEHSDLGLVNFRFLQEVSESVNIRNFDDKLGRLSKHNGTAISSIVFMLSIVDRVKVNESMRNAPATWSIISETTNLFLVLSEEQFVFISDITNILRLKLEIPQYMG